MSVFSDIFGPDPHEPEIEDTVTIPKLIKRGKSMMLHDGKFYIVTVKEIEASKLAEVWEMEEPKK